VLDLIPLPLITARKLRLAEPVAMRKLNPPLLFAFTLSAAAGAAAGGHATRRGTVATYAPGGGRGGGVDAHAE